jgi:hypothetical protein
LQPILPRLYVIVQVLVRAFDSLRQLVQIPAFIRLDELRNRDLAARDCVDDCPFPKWSVE